MTEPHPIRGDNTAHLISKARRNINQFLEDEMHKVDLPGLVPSHGDIIAVLLRIQRMTMSDLADAIQRDRSTVTTLVRKLEKMGYVTMEENPDDTRSHLVSLTEKGQNLKETFCPISESLSLTIWNDIGDADRLQFRSTLQKIIKNFQKVKEKS